MRGLSKSELDVGALRASAKVLQGLRPVDPETGNKSSFACYTRALPGVECVTMLLYQNFSW